jgi:hypothetical protein
MEKETVEGIAEKLYPVNNTGSMFMANREELNNSLKQEGFINGYKLAQEQLYSKEDMQEMYNYGYGNYMPIDKAFEQFIRKV